MARIETKAPSKRKPIVESLPFTKTNYQILGAGLLLIVLGYVALAQPPWDSAWALDVAPVLLVIGYCVMIPVGILYRKTEKAAEPSAMPTSQQQQPSAAKS